MPNCIGWFLSEDIALTEIVLILLVCRIVLLQYSPKATSNRLSLLPFYFLSLSCIFALSQYYLLSFEGKPVRFALLFNVNKTYFMYSGIAI